MFWSRNKKNNFQLCTFILRPVAAAALKTITVYSDYCIFRNFGENFIFANSVKIHICDVKNSRLRHDLPTSVNDRVILPFFVRVIFPRNFAYKFGENKTHKKFQIYIISTCCANGSYSKTTEDTNCFLTMIFVSDNE